MNTKVVEVHYFTKEKIGLFLQLLLTIALVVLGVLYFINKININYIYALVSLLLFVMAFNNKYTYKKKNMTKIYLIVGVLLLISVILEVIV